MPRFAANLTMLWPELDVYDRFRAAAEAGFRRVEILFVHELDPARVERALKEHGLELVLFDPAPGKWAGGESGLVSLLGREEEFLRTVRDAVTSAPRFGTRLLNALAGIPPPGVSRGDAERTAVANLRAAVPLAQEIGATLLVEAINSVDMPGYFADTVHRAAALTYTAARGTPSVRSSSSMAASANRRFWSGVRPRRRSALRNAIPWVGSSARPKVRSPRAPQRRETAM